MKKTPAFDSKDLLRRLAGDRALFELVLETFGKDAPRQLEQLRKALDDKNLDLLMRQAHTLRGASANMGASVLSGIAAEIETAGRAGDLDRAAALYPRIVTEYRRFQKEADDEKLRDA